VSRRLDKLDKALDRLQTIFAVAALVCLVIGYYYDGQIYSYLSQAPETRTLTLSPASTNSTGSTCTISPCTYNETLSQPITVEATLSGNVTHIAAQRAAQTAWYWKTQFDNAGTVLLVAYLFLLGIRGIRFVVRKCSQIRNKSPGNLAHQTKSDTVSCQTKGQQSRES
jgi:hypothetical protein